MILKAYKYRIYPTKKQQEFFGKHFGSVRFVYNHFLALRSEAYKTEKKNISGFECKRRLIALKEEYQWLKDINSQSLQQSVLDLERAYGHFFKKLGGYPRFKKKHNRQSFTVPQNFQIEDNKLYIPKLGSGIKLVLHRPIEGSFKSLTITKTPSGKYFASIICEVEIAKLPVVEQETGVDLGLTHFATLSTGEKIEHPKTFMQLEKKLVRLQRELSRKKKGSSNYNKAMVKVARLHEKIASQRSDFLHKTSRRLINENQVICRETLYVKGMVQNKHLSKAISDSGWGEFVRQIDYKADWYGRTVNKIPMFYPSSKECSICRFVYKDLKLSQRVWTCPNCGAVHDRDINASSVIKYVGQDMPEVTPAESAASVTSVLSMKQVGSKKQEAQASLKMHGN